MASTVLCSIVSAEKEIFSGQVEMVVATGTIGELGILPGHTPLISGVQPGPVRLVLAGGEEEIFFASGGYIEVQPTSITILADTALRHWPGQISPNPRQSKGHKPHLREDHHVRQASALRFAVVRVPRSSRVGRGQ